MSEKWTRIPSVKTVAEVVEALKNRGFEVFLVESRKDALAKIKGMIPRGSGVMTGGSVTLEEIGFKEWLKAGNHGWKNVYAEITSENNDAKRSELRRKSIVADYFLAGVNAITRQGELVACDMSGSRVGAYPFAAKNLILVSGIQKIVEDVEEARRRVREYVFPLTDQTTMKMYGYHCSMAKWVIMEKELTPKRTTIILVKERIGW
jgi:L-lactate utilization protein LutB